MSHAQALIPTRYGRLKLPWPMRVARNIGRYLFRALVVIIFSRIYGSTAAALLSWWIGSLTIGLLWPWTVVIVMAAAFTSWCIREPWEILQSLHGWRRSLRNYWFRWDKSMWCVRGQNPHLPTPIRLQTRSTGFVDKLRVYVPIGYAPTLDFAGDALDRLQWAFKAQSCRMFDPNPKRRTIELWNLIQDPLIEPVQPFARNPESLPKAIEAALGEDGLPWLAKIRGGAAHAYVCGISGSGKGSVLGAYFNGLQTGIEDGTIEARGIDPQASELGMYRHLLKRIAYTREDAADMLEELVAIMHRRTRKLFGISRQHHPTPGDPFYFVPIDEGLDLLDKSDRKLYNRIVRALTSLLRMGRKASILVMFIAQRAELELVDRLRKDFQIFIALEQNLETDVDMVLGRGALKAGAKAHLISNPGEAYVAGRKGITRVRFPESTDDYIAELPPAPGNENPENLPPAPGDDELVDMGFA